MSINMCDAKFMASRMSWIISFFVNAVIVFHPPVFRFSSHFDVGCDCARSDKATARSINSRTQTLCHLFAKCSKLPSFRTEMNECGGTKTRAPRRGNQLSMGMGKKSRIERGLAPRTQRMSINSIKYYIILRFLSLFSRMEDWADEESLHWAFPFHVQLSNAIVKL